MTSELIELQTLLVADLATRGETFCLTGWTPKRAFVPRYELKDVKQLQVVVTPASRAGSRQTRALVQRRLGVYVGVLKLLAPGQSDQVAPPADLSELDALVRFVEQLDDLFYPKHGGFYAVGDGKFTCVESSAVPLYDLDLMHARRQFTSVLSVDFVVH
ncbi:MAG: hypothetical protein KF774_17790 [Planctomyces sp.]|nr:hypothetical protein [Planctomyces sp.]